MASSAVTAAAAPPLLPTPPNNSPALLPTPPSFRRLIPSPASPAPSVGRFVSPALLPTPPSFRRLIPSPAFPAPSIGRFVPSAMSLAPSIRSPSRSPATPSPPGRASASESWVRDKAAHADLAPPSSLEGSKGFKIPGRASLSESWVEDKLAGAAPLDVPANSCCGKRIFIPTPSADTGKKQRYESPPPSPEDSDPDSESMYYAGPAFLNAPPASDLPIPYSLLAPPASALPIPHLLLAR